MSIFLSMHTQKSESIPFVIYDKHESANAYHNKTLSLFISPFIAHNITAFYFDFIYNWITEHTLTHK